MGKMLGMRQNGYWKIEAGKTRLTVDDLLLIADELDADVVIILKGDTATSPSQSEPSNLSARVEKLESLISTILTFLKKILSGGGDR